PADQLLGAPAQERGGLVQVLAVVQDGDLDGACRGGGPADKGPGPQRGGEVGRTDRRRAARHEQRPCAGHGYTDAGQGVGLEGLVQGDGLVQVVQLDQEGVVAGGAAPHHAAAPPVTGANARRAMPSASNTSRIRRAMATAPGESPCTHTESARTATSDPSTAVTTPSVTRRSMRRATSSASCSTAPGSRRETRR